uniref:FAM69 protein-kinase domain-containing protein n=1 Tax=Graphocephala atropunctata TaxID=36148 RepID=A0A1B6LT47_9HEMI
MYVLQKNIIGLLSLFLLVVGILLVFVYNNILVLDLASLANTNHCPLCYGMAMCICLGRGNFTLNSNHLWENVLSACSLSKSHIIFGKCAEDWVVVKKRALDLTENEVKFDHMSELLKSLDELNESHYDPQKFKCCPSHTKLVEYYIENVVEKENNMSDIYLNTFFMIHANMEPIIQQVTKDWAVAEYLGGCGDFTVWQYCGDTLTWVVPELDWMARSFIAKQLLQFAFNATFRHPRFSFYFTDMSPDNFAVSPEDEVRLVDLENVIVVDKYPEGECLDL